MTRRKEWIERDLMWARHILKHGTTPEQRDRGRVRAELFQKELYQYYAEVAGGEPVGLVAGRAM